MQIQLLTANDKKLYLDHLSRIYQNKGLLSLKNKDWVNQNQNAYVSENLIDSIFNSDLIWAVIDNDNIVQSMRTSRWKKMPIFTIVNYKSELIGPFNARKNLFPLWDEVLKYYESIEYYTSYLARPLTWAHNRKTPYFESHAPLNRYNTYMEEIIPANEVSKSEIYNTILADRYPVDMVLISMHLKQEFRNFKENQKYFL